MNDLSKLTGQNGCYYYDSTATLTADFYAVEMNADTVIATLTESNMTGDTTADGVTRSNISGKTLSQGVIITPYEEKYSQIALTSGSVILRTYKPV